MRAKGIDDLFGHVPQKGELTLSDGADEDDARAPEVSHGPIQHTPETIRARMLGIIATARAAQTMPFTPRDLRSHLAMFPYMAEWLPGGEGDRLLAEFMAEIARLKAAASA